MDRWKTWIASPSDKEFLVAEIYYNDELWAEISQETGELWLTIYPHCNHEPWEFDVQEVIDIITHAKLRLTGQIP